MGEVIHQIVEKNWLTQITASPYSSPKHNWNRWIKELYINEDISKQLSDFWRGKNILSIRAMEVQKKSYIDFAITQLELLYVKEHHSQ